MPESRNLQVRVSPDRVEVVALGLLACVCLRSGFAATPLPSRSSSAVARLAGIVWCSPPGPHRGVAGYDTDGACTVASVSAGRLPWYAPAASSGVTSAGATGSGLGEGSVSEVGGRGALATPPPRPIVGELARTTRERL